MSIWVLITDFVAKIFEPAVKLVDELHTSKEEELEIKLKLEQIKSEIEKAKIALSSKMIEYHTQLVESRSDVVIAEAKGESWIQRTWRPILMVMFAIIIVATWLGFSSSTVSEEMHLRLLDIVQGGIWGYIGARSFDKAVGGAKGWFKKKKAKKGEMADIDPRNYTPLEIKRKNNL